VKRAKTRQLLTAAAAGMLAPVAINRTQKMYSTQIAGAAEMRRAALTSKGSGSPQYGRGFRAVTARTGPAPSASYNSAAHFAGDLIPT